MAPRGAADAGRAALFGAAVLLGWAGCGGSKPSAADGAGSGERRRAASAGGHEGDDGVALQSSRGVLDPEQIRVAVEPHSNELSGCYIKRVGARHWLGGHVTMKWQLAGDGTIESVFIADSDLGAWPVEQCLLAVAQKMTFPAPRGGATDFAVPLEFSATGSAVLWDEQQSAEAVGEQLQQLAECSAPAGDDAADDGPPPAAPDKQAGKPARAGKAASKSPAPTAKPPAAPPLSERRGRASGEPIAAPRSVLITLYVGNRGQPQSVGFATPDPQGFSASWADCAQRAALRWRLPDPRGTVAKLAIRYAGAP